MDTGFVIIKKKPVVTGKRRGKREYSFRLALTESAALRKVFELLPSMECLEKLPASIEGDEVFQSCDNLITLRLIVKKQPVLDVTQKELRLIEKLAFDPNLDSWEYIYYTLGEQFAKDQRLAMTSFLWMLYASNRDARSHTRTVRTHICNLNGYMASKALVSALDNLHP